MTSRACTVLVIASLEARIPESNPHLRVIRWEPGVSPTREQQDARVLVIDLLPQIDPVLDLIKNLPHLELVQLLVAGFEQWVGRLPAHISLANARGAHGLAVAEWVVATLLAHYRQLPGFISSQAARLWDHHPTDSIAGKTIAVLGAGDIGRHVGAMLTPFGCEITLVGRTSRPGVTGMPDFRPHLCRQDAIVIALPATGETIGMVDATFLAEMKDGAILVNAGRGTIVDTSALSAAASAERISAILDVTDPEPLPPEHPLWTTPNVTITPHIAGSTHGCWERAWQVAVMQIEAYLAGREPDNIVIRATERKF